MGQEAHCTGVDRAICTCAYICVVHTGRKGGGGMALARHSGPVGQPLIVTRTTPVLDVQRRANVAEGADHGGNNSSGSVGNAVGVESSCGRGASDWERRGGGGGGSRGRRDEKNDWDGEDAPAKYSEDAWSVRDSANVARDAIHWDSSSSSGVHDAAGGTGKAFEINTDDVDDIGRSCGGGVEADGAEYSRRDS